LLGLAVNLVLGIVKLVGGVLGRSFALISDAVNSLGDSLISIVVLFALAYAQRPADEQHPYGHTRAEAVAGSNVALLIIMSALYVGYVAIFQLPVPHEVPSAWTLWIAGANILIKQGLYRYKLQVGNRTGSTAIIANAWDHWSDSICSLAVLVGLGAVRWAGPDYIWADAIAALVVVAAILWSGLKLFHTTASDLLDPQADEKLVLQIRRVAESVPGVRAVEKLWVRKTGMEYLADIHIQVAAQMTVEEGHGIGHEVKSRLGERVVMLRDVLVHLEPFPHIHEKTTAGSERES
jgi:cation diffusion facilitator family transporter